MKQIPALPKLPESLWLGTVENLPSFPKLDQNIEVDVTVVGGGITGITTAYLLSKAGLKVALLEAGKIVTGTTGHTTAKVTSQHHLIYDELIKQFGFDDAKLYYEANEEASKLIKSLIKQYQIDCGFKEEDAYVFTNQESYVQKLKDEMAAYEKIGINGAYLDAIPLKDIAAIAAVRMDAQFQFHPLQYIKTLVEQLKISGCQLYEQTTALDIDTGTESKVITQNGSTVTSKHIVICTHYPFYDGLGLYFSRMHAERSYALAIKTSINYPGGMYISAEEPSRSIRSVTTPEGDPLLIIGGQNHKTGQGTCTFNHYELLHEYAIKMFNANEIAYRWSAQDLVTGDKIPYIGRITSFATNIYVATGFKKWGMTTSTVAAMLISDLVQEKQNKFEALFSPSRSMSLKTVSNLIVENLDVAKHLIGGKLEYVQLRPEQLKNDEGSAVMVNGRRAGAYKDNEGKLYVVDTTCTHMGCEVEWNDGERTWDCPCHGSRFSFKGEVMEGPAQLPLKPITMD